MRPLKTICEGYIIPPVSERTLAWLQSELAQSKPLWFVFEEEATEEGESSSNLSSLLSDDPE
jgi:hypothetical protein